MTAKDHFKLKGIYDHFYTARGWEIAAGRRQAAADFYNALLAEASYGRAEGKAILDSMLEEQP